MKRLRWTLTVGLLVGLAGTAFAQVTPAAGAKETSLERFVPADAILYVRFEGFAAGADAFKGTALKAIVDEPQVAAFGKELMQVISQLAAKEAQDLLFTPDDVRLLLDRECVLTVFGDPRRDVSAALLVNAGEEADAIRKRVDRLLQKARDNGTPLAEEKVKDVPVTVINGRASIAWFGDVLIAARNLETLRALLGTAAGDTPAIVGDAELKAMRAKVKGAPEFLTVHFRVDRLIKGVRRPARDPQHDPVRVLALDALRSIHLGVKPEAPGVRIFTYMHVPGEPKGLWSILPRVPIDEDAMLASVPADVETAVLLRADAGKMFDAIETIVRDAGEAADFKAGLEEIKEKVGFDLRRDLFGSLGDRLILQGLTDPQGLPAAVLTWNVLDEKKVADCLDKLAKLPPGRMMRLGRNDYNGVPVVEITMAGPMAAMPFQPCIAVKGDRLIAASTRQALITVLDGPAAPEKSLATNPDFIAQRKRMPKGVVMLGYEDVKGNFPVAYASLRQSLAMLPVMAGPDFQDVALLAGKLPQAEIITRHLFGSVGTVRYDGEGFMVESYGPVGGITNPSGAGTVAVGGVMAGFLLPALGRAKEAAQRASCMNNLRQIGLAMKMYATDHDDEYPDSLAPLLKEGYLTTTKVLICPSSGSRVPEDYPVDFKGATLAELKPADDFSDYMIWPGLRDDGQEPTRILVYEKDRAHGGEGRNVCFTDGHVKWYPEAEFQQLLKRQGDEMKKEDR